MQKFTSYFTCNGYCSRATAGLKYRTPCTSPQLPPCFLAQASYDVNPKANSPPEHKKCSFGVVTIRRQLRRLPDDKVRRVRSSRDLTTRVGSTTRREAPAAGHACWRAYRHCPTTSEQHSVGASTMSAAHKYSAPYGWEYSPS